MEFSKSNYFLFFILLASAHISWATAEKDYLKQVEKIAQKSLSKNSQQKFEAVMKILNHLEAEEIAWNKKDDKADSKKKKKKTLLNNDQNKSVFF